MDPKQTISPWYHRASYQMSYQFPLLPVPGKRFMRCDEFLPIEPPIVTKMTGRPRKKRIRGKNESNPTSKMEKLSKMEVLQTCGNCQEEGHNKKSCKKMSNQIGGGESQGSSQRQRSKTRGYGVHLDLNTGQTTLNPGMASEVVVSLGENMSQTSMVIDVDPQTRYPIPNERELKNKDKRHAPCSATVTRKIKFVGDGLEVGDGTTTVVLLAGEFLKEAKPFIEDGVHPQNIIQSYRTTSYLNFLRGKRMWGYVCGSIVKPIHIDNEKYVEQMDVW
ncbi:TCP-1/cpn60 chaperonin family protein [Perilla frutescens var. hirtella]|nr:TCP-1/cpn60 chaperonin family protein [Perilla frutescens var. hirtella]